MNSEQILVVEDDQTLRERLSLSFTKAGYFCLTAESTIQAFDILASSKIDWCLCDLKLGDRSGTEVVDYINQNKLKIKIVMLTGYGSIVSAVECIKSGVSDYLSKPVSFQEILGAFTGTKKVIKNQKIASLQEVEWEHIQKVLSDNDGNISKTAKMLNLHRRSLQRKLSNH